MRLLWRRHLCRQCTLTFSYPGLSSANSRTLISFLSSPRKDGASWSQGFMTNEHIFFHVTTQNWYLYWMKYIQITEEEDDLKKMKKSKEFKLIQFGSWNSRQDSRKNKLWFFFHVYFSSVFFALLFRKYLQQFAVLSDWEHALSQSDPLPSDEEVD